MEQQLVTLLELVRVEGIVKMLWENIDHDVLAHTVQQVFQINNENTKAELERLTRYQLIRIADQHTDIITAELVNRYYEQYRYGLKPGFTLYLLCGPRTEVTDDQVFEQLKQQLETIPDMTDATIRSIRCKSYMKLADNITEVSMSFLKKHSYLDENEVPKFIYEFEEFFIWINLEERYMAVKNVPDRVAETVITQLKEILHQGITYIKLTKPVIDAAFGTKQRKGTYLKANATDAEAEKITVSDSRLREKASVLNGLATYDMASTFLEQTMEDESINTLGINCEKGKLYLTKNVPATQFREWSVSAIQRIIPLITAVEKMDDFENFKARNVIDRTAWQCSKLQATIFERIVYGLFNGLRTGQSISYINLEVREIWNNTQKYWIPYHVAECPTCGEYTYLYCMHCHSTTIRINNSGKLYCSSCGENLETCLCDEGHAISIVNPYDTLRLFPSGETLDYISRIITDDLLLPFGSSFSIARNHVELYPLRDVASISVTDIPELKIVHDIELSEGEYDVLHRSLAGIKEKCRAAKNETCNKCTLGKSRECLMKIFTTYQRYRPSPHNGDEFADVSFPVTVNGKELTLVGVMKSAIPSKGNLTRSSKPAREMLQQIFMMCQDGRAGLIAAICPSRFQDQFQADLQYLSRLTGKPIVVLDDIYMCKQLKAFRNDRKFP